MSRYHLDLFNQIHPFFVGFDSMFNTFDTWVKPVGYPPHNVIVKDEGEYVIELALAGFKKSDINVSFENRKLTIESVKEEKTEGIQYRGIAQRQFSKVFTVAEDIEVKDAKLEDGLLSILLKKIEPKKSLKTISIK